MSGKQRLRKSGLYPSSCKGGGGRGTCHQVFVPIPFSYHCSDYLFQEILILNCAQIRKSNPCVILLLERQRYLFLIVLTPILSSRVVGEPVLKLNTGILKCQVRQMISFLMLRPYWPICNEDHSDQVPGSMRHRVQVLLTLLLLLFLFFIDVVDQLLTIISIFNPNAQVVSWKFGNNYVYPTKQVSLFILFFIVDVFEIHRNFKTKSMSIQHWLWR